MKTESYWTETSPCDHLGLIGDKILPKCWFIAFYISWHEIFCMQTFVPQLFLFLLTRWNVDNRPYPVTLQLQPADSWTSHPHPVSGGLKLTLSWLLHKPLTVDEWKSNMLCSFALLSLSAVSSCHPGSDSSSLDQRHGTEPLTTVSLQKKPAGSFSWRRLIHLVLKPFFVSVGHFYISPLPAKQ